MVNKFKQQCAKQCSLIFFSITLLNLLFFLPLSADLSPSLTIGAFSSEQAGQPIPAGWEELTFKKIENHTEYRTVREDGQTVVRAHSQASASGLIKKIKIDLREYPILQWRWKVNNVIQSSDVYRKDGDDYASRIYITFEYDPRKVGFGRKLKYKAGRLIFGDIPIAAINYIWDRKTPKGSFVDNAYTDFVKMIVVESGEEKVGEWVSEQRNVYEDYQKAFGEEPSLINGVAIMTDTDNTGESAIAFYGDISFHQAP